MSSFLGHHTTTTHSIDIRSALNLHMFICKDGKQAGALGTSISQPTSTPQRPEASSPDDRCSYPSHAQRQLSSHAHPVPQHRDLGPILLHDRLPRNSLIQTTDIVPVNMHHPV
jgi:hypothetical protein